MIITAWYHEALVNYNQKGLVTKKSKLYKYLRLNMWPYNVGIFDDYEALFIKRRTLFSEIGYLHWLCMLFKANHTLIQIVFHTMVPIVGH